MLGFFLKEKRGILYENVELFVLFERAMFGAWFEKGGFLFIMGWYQPGESFMCEMSRTV